MGAKKKHRRTRGQMEKLKMQPKRDMPVKKNTNKKNIRTNINPNRKQNTQKLKTKKQAEQQNKDGPIIDPKKKGRPKTGRKIQRNSGQARKYSKHQGKNKNDKQNQ